MRGYESAARARPPALLLLVLLFSAGCAARPGAAGGGADAALAGPRPARVVVLGTGQDGGLPQAACACVHCARAGADPTYGRLVSSIAVVGRGEAPSVHLLDAGPDLPRQLARLGRLGLLRPGRNPVDGVFVTHAHAGHYLGLAQFGREVMGSTRLPVHGTARLLAFLEGNGPWDLLVRLGNVELREIRPGGGAVDLGGGVAVEAVPVPHRDEYSDTVAFVVRGPRRSLLYLPDLDSWDRGWTAALSPEDLLASVDVALVDGTFFSEEELPGRTRSEVPHPPMIATAERFASLVGRGPRRTRVLFTHLNHGNPANDPASPERARLRALGFDVVSESAEFSLE